MIFVYFCTGVREAVRLGVKAVEIDITLTADNEPIIIHDSTVDRTTDGTGGFFLWSSYGS